MSVRTMKICIERPNLYWWGLRVQAPSNNLIQTVHINNVHLGTVIANLPALAALPRLRKLQLTLSIRNPAATGGLSSLTRTTQLCIIENAACGVGPAAAICSSACCRMCVCSMGRQYQSESDRMTLDGAVFVNLCSTVGCVLSLFPNNK